MKPFKVLIIGAAVWGITLALAFVGGMAVGNSQENEIGPTLLSADSVGVDENQGQFDATARDDFRQRIQSGEATQEEIDQQRQRFQGGGQRGQFGGPGAGGQEGEDHSAGTGSN